MACPLCGEQCRCSAVPAADAHVSVLIDPEGFTDSEQQFASSIDLHHEDDDDAVVHDILNDAGFVGLATTSAPVVTPMLTGSAPSVTTMLVESATSEPPEFYRPQEPPVWREEVSSKVDAYHAKRGRGRRYDPSSSLSLDFDPMADSENAASPRFAPVRLEVVEKAPDTN